MAHILVTNSTSAQEDSISRRLLDEAVARITEACPDRVMACRDFGANPILHLPAASPAPAVSRKLSEALIACALPTSS
jgi:hypothetical protein